MATDCRLTTLACARGCRVDRCDHGTLHVTVGDVTLRRSANGLGALTSALADAQRKLALDARLVGQRPC